MYGSDPQSDPSVGDLGSADLRSPNSVSSSGDLTALPTLPQPVAPPLLALSDFGSGSLPNNNQLGFPPPPLNSSADQSSNSLALENTPPYLFPSDMTLTPEEFAEKATKNLNSGQNTVSIILDVNGDHGEAIVGIVKATIGEEPIFIAIPPPENAALNGYEQYTEGLNNALPELQEELKKCEGNAILTLAGGSTLTPTNRFWDNCTQIKQSRYPDAEPITSENYFEPGNREIVLSQLEKIPNLAKDIAPYIALLKMLAAHGNAILIHAGTTEPGAIDLMALIPQNNNTVHTILNKQQVNGDSDKNKWRADIIAMPDYHSLPHEVQALNLDSQAFTSSSYTAALLSGIVYHLTQRSSNVSENRPPNAASES